MAGLPARIADALRPIDAVQAAWLFGSRARGDAREDSDLDVAVLYRREIDGAARERARREIVAALSDGLGSVGERADVVDLDDADSAVAFRAVTEGALVLARSEAARVRAVAFIYRRYDDEAPRRDLFRRAALAAAQRMDHDRR